MFSRFRIILNIFNAQRDSDLFNLRRPFKKAVRLSFIMHSRSITVQKRQIHYLTQSSYSTCQCQTCTFYRIKKHLSERKLHYLKHFKQKRTVIQTSESKTTPQLHVHAIAHSNHDDNRVSNLPNARELTFLPNVVRDEQTDFMITRLRNFMFLRLHKP